MEWAIIAGFSGGLLGGYLLGLARQWKRLVDPGKPGAAVLVHDFGNHVTMLVRLDREAAENLDHPKVQARVALALAEAML